MTQQGTHTWDLILHYHRCPSCGFINESRQDFQPRSNEWIKELKCERCHQVFTVTKPKRRTFGPLFGKPQPIEMKWD